DVIEELGDRTRCTGIQLALEVVEIELRRRRLRVDLRVGGDGDLEVSDRLQACNQIRGIRETVRMRLITRAPLGRVAPQGHDVSDALVPVPPRDVQDLAATGAHTGQVGCAGERRLALDAGHELMSAV